MGTKGSVGERIRQLRISLKITQDRLSEAADISRDGLARIERGNRSPGFKTLSGLATALGVPVEQLWQPDSRPLASHDALRVRRVQVALGKVPPAFADTVVDVVEELCSGAARLSRTKASGKR